MTDADPTRFEPRREQSLRMERDPMFTPLDVAAFVVSLVMVCMPLALGAFGAN